MKIEVIRYSSSEESTLGLLLIDNQFQCYTLEDEFREEKLMAETRIPAGTYKLELRKFGGHHEKYLVKYGADFHHGMLQVMDVKGFTDILIHKGNTDDDTAGCLLLGDGANNNQTKDGFISHSGLAYDRIYPNIASALLKGEPVTISYQDSLAQTTVSTSKVDTDQLYLREVPNGLEKAILLSDLDLEIIGSNNGWRKVKIEGWVDRKFIE